MARSNRRRILGCESLESRELLSGPTADQQYMLQLLNLVRTNPSAGAQKILANLDGNTTNTLNFYNINLQQVKNTISSMQAQPPLAWNDMLGAAAQGHSIDMNNTGTQSHTGSDGSSPQTRMANAGYTNSSSSAEDAYAWGSSVMETMQAFLIDWGVADDGHRTNIMEPNVPADQAYRDVGIGLVNSTRPGFGPDVITVDFAAKQNEQPTLLGVVYNDPNHTQFYAPGEGQAGVSISATNLATGQTTSTQSQSAGGYSINLAPGNYNVTATENGQVIRSQNVAMGSVNVEVDYDLSNPWQGGSAPTPPAPQPVTVAPPVRIAPVITPAVTVTPPPVTPPAPTPVTPPPAPVTPPPAPVIPPPPAPVTPPSVSPTNTQPSTTTAPSTPPAPAVSSIFALASNANWTSWTANDGS